MILNSKKIIELFARQNINIDLPWEKAICQDTWHYRRKARIGVQYNKLGQAIVGFRQKSSNTLTPIKNCPVLTPKLAGLFPLLTQLINSLSITESIGHIEVIDGDPNGVVLVIRQLKKINRIR